MRRRIEVLWGSRQQRCFVEPIAIADELNQVGRGEVAVQFTQVIEVGLDED